MKSIIRVLRHHAHVQSNVGGSDATQLSAQDILHSNVRNVAGNYTEIAVKNVYYPALPSAALNRFTLPWHKPLVGRNDLLKQIEERLQSQDATNVICLTGAAGAGKSALALEVAYRFSALFPDGCYWVDLRSSDIVQAVRALLATIGVANIEQLGDDFFALAKIAREQLTGKRILLILDNAESVIRLHRQKILALCPGAPARTIITSRVMMDTDDIRVSALSDEDALKLLESKGIAVATQRDDAIRLVRRLGNLALAIEIIARRMCITTPAQSCADALRELEAYSSIVDALRLPLGDMPDDSIAATFALSYNLLDEQLRTAFHALGLCAPSGAPVEAIAHMCGVAEPTARDLLRALAMLSLTDFDGKHARLQPLLGDYARVRALACPSERDLLIVRHASYFGIEVGSRYQRALNDEQDPLPALSEIDAHFANVQLAQERALAPEFPSPKLAVEITDCLALYWRQRHVTPQQLLEWIRRACLLAEQTEQKINLANLLQTAGDLHAFQNQHEEALELHRRALELFTECNSQLGQANALRAIGDVYTLRGEREIALDHYHHALELFTSIQNRLGAANTLKAIGDVRASRKELDAALQAYERALELFTRIGERLGQANVLKSIGDVESFRDQHDRALRSYMRALELFEAIGERLGQANTIKAIGDTQASQDNRDEALSTYMRALELFTKINDPLGRANTLKAIGDVQAFRKDATLASYYYNQALELFTETRSTLGQASVFKAVGDLHAFSNRYDQAQKLYARALELFTAAGSALGQANTLRAMGDIATFHREHSVAEDCYQRALDLFVALDDRLGQANTLRAIADLRALCEEEDSALAHYEQALELYIASGSKLGQAHALQAIGGLYARRGEVALASRLYRQALALFSVIGSVLGQANTYVALGQITGKASYYETAIGLYASIGDAYSLARAKFYYALDTLNKDSAAAAILITEVRAICRQIGFEEGVRAADDLLSQTCSMSDDQKGAPHIHRSTDAAIGEATR
ncbi:MAG: tetratricopeptide repeat protein [Thermoflexales bacterium]|nr:tetratricopeptide repeat protein [Thermoflexales bacterium]